MRSPGGNEGSSKYKHECFEYNLKTHWHFPVGAKSIPSRPFWAGWYSIKTYQNLMILIRDPNNTVTGDHDHIRPEGRRLLPVAPPWPNKVINRNSKILHGAYIYSPSTAMTTGCTLKFLSYYMIRVMMCMQCGRYSVVHGPAQSRKPGQAGPV